MSIVWTLRKYVDSIQQREEQAAQERDRRVARQQGLGDGEGDTDKLGPCVCRICGHRAEDEEYCPHCLANTMVAVPDAGTD